MFEQGGRTSMVLTWPASGT